MTGAQLERSPKAALSDRLAKREDSEVPNQRPDRRILRASDADREQVVERLRHHAGEGRLTLDELSERVGSALTAKTVGELEDLVYDLPRDDAQAVVRPTSWRDARLPALLTTATRLMLLNVLAFGFFITSPGHRHFGLLVWIMLFSILRLARRASSLSRRRARLEDHSGRRLPPRPPAPPWTLR